MFISSQGQVEQLLTRECLVLMVDRYFSFFIGDRKLPLDQAEEEKNSG
jgi:hypothetical protein